MGNPLFSQMNPTPLSHIQNLMKLMQGKDPNAVMGLLAQRNPQFAKFMEECKGKTPEQVAQQYGIDPNVLHQFLH